MIEPSEKLSEWVSRKEACEILSISKSGIRYLEGVHLEPMMKSKKVFYRREQINAVLLERSGKSAATAFKAFREGKSQLDVIIEYSMSPQLVQNLYKIYLRIIKEDSNYLFFPYPKEIRLRVESLGVGELTLDKIISALEIAVRVHSFRGCVPAVVENRKGEISD